MPCGTYHTSYVVRKPPGDVEGVVVKYGAYHEDLLMWKLCKKLRTSIPTPLIIGTPCCAPTVDYVMSSGFSSCAQSAVYVMSSGLLETASEAPIGIYLRTTTSFDMRYYDHN